MSWFRNKRTDTSIPFGSLRIVKAWSGHYVIEEYGGRFFIGTTPCVRWWLVEDAGEFKQREDAIERIRFMEKLDRLITQIAE